MESTIAHLVKECKESTFVNTFKTMQLRMQKINESKGFNETWKRAVESGDVEFINSVKGLKLALIIGELSECLEGIRKGNPPDSHIPDFSSEEAELADVQIRLMNYASDTGARLAEATIAKSSYNENRPFKHSGKL